jgi:hypothetical protein
MGPNGSWLDGDDIELLTASSKRFVGAPAATSPNSKPTSTGSQSRSNPVGSGEIEPRTRRLKNSGSIQS